MPLSPTYQEFLKLKRAVSYQARFRIEETFERVTKEMVMTNHEIKGSLKDSLTFESVSSLSLKTDLKI